MFCPNRECLDFVESGEPGEYRDDIEVCPLCGTRLVHERPTFEADEREGADHGEPLPVPEGPLAAAASFNYRQDADLAASMLRANGVPALVFGDGFGNVVELGSRASVMVAEGQLELARALLEQEAAAPEGGRQ